MTKRSISTSTRRLGLRVLKRRGWLLVLCAVGVAAVAQALSTLTSRTYTAQALLVVPSGANHHGPGAGNDATKLASTDAVVMQNDTALAADGARAVGTDASTFSKHLTILNDTDTGLIRVRYAASSARAAVAGSTAVAEAVTGPSATALYPAGSLSIVSLPAKTTLTASGGASSMLLPIGIVLGFLLGGILMSAWERNDPRVDDLDGLTDECGAPTTEVGGMANAAAGALLRRWKELADVPAPVIAILPCGPGLQEKTQLTVAYLRAQALRAGLELRESSDTEHGEPSPGAMTLITGGQPGGPEAGEAVAQQADLTVVLADVNTRAGDVRRSVTTLERFGVACSWALLAPRRVKDLRKAVTTDGSARERETSSGSYTADEATAAVGDKE